jgi:hypothetical protein
MSDQSTTPFLYKEKLEELKKELKPEYDELISKPWYANSSEKTLYNALVSIMNAKKQQTNVCVLQTKSFVSKAGKPIYLLTVIDIDSKQIKTLFVKETDFNSFKIGYAYNVRILNDGVKSFNPLSSEPVSNDFIINLLDFIPVFNINEWADISTLKISNVYKLNVVPSRFFKKRNFDGSKDTFVINNDGVIGFKFSFPHTLLKKDVYQITSYFSSEGNSLLLNMFNTNTMEMVASQMSDQEAETYFNDLFVGTPFAVFASLTNIKVTDNVASLNFNIISMLPLA